MATADEPVVTDEAAGQGHDVVLALGARRPVPEHDDGTGPVVVRRRSTADPGRVARRS